MTRKHREKRGPTARLTGLAVASAALLLTTGAHAANTIKQPGVHPGYAFDAEPHMILALDGARGLGAGFRGTFTLVHNGFVSKINNSVGLGVGGDVPFGNGSDLWIPVVMQWNFWLSDRWSVFGEPGLGAWSDHLDRPRPALFVGGRVLFGDHVALVLRAGYPTLSVGVSFLL